MGSLRPFLPAVNKAGIPPTDRMIGCHFRAKFHPALGYPGTGLAGKSCGLGDGFVKHLH
jgi:hypothetical protein